MSLLHSLSVLNIACSWQSVVKYSSTCLACGGKESSAGSSYILDFDRISGTFSVEFDILLQLCLTSILGTVKLNLPITAAFKFF
jgi:hypothetical protein